YRSRRKRPHLGISLIGLAMAARGDFSERPAIPTIPCYVADVRKRDLDGGTSGMIDRPGEESTSEPSVATDVTRQELPYRLRQQSLLGEFGRFALQTRDIGEILQRATELCAQGLDTGFAKVLEYVPDDERLLVRA